MIELIGPGAPPPHVHKGREEAFYIVEGTFNFVLGHDHVEGTKGAFVVVPRGTRHGFTAGPGCRALVFTIPAGLAGFFRELGAGITAGKSNAEIRAALAGKYDSFPSPE